MARDIARDDKDLYRAVITTTTTREGQEPVVLTSTFGPYNDLGTTKSRITSAKNKAYTVTMWGGRESTRHLTYGHPWTERTVEGYVELAEVVWRRVT